jgi:putative ABC transport system permease protein
VELRTIQPGFDHHNLLTIRISLSDGRFAKTSAVSELVREGVERVSALPGVSSAGATCCLPLENDLGIRFVILDRPLAGPYHAIGAWRIVSPTYFDVLRIPITRGHGFSERDRAGSPAVAMINEAMAHQYWPHDDPLTGRLQLGKGSGVQFQDEPARQIIGVASDVRDGALNRDPRPTIYIPLAQLPDALNAFHFRLLPLAWMIRVQGTPYALSSAIEFELKQLAKGAPIAHGRSMDDVMRRSTNGSEFSMDLMTVFGVVALFLATIGVYGVMAHSIEQRKREMGIRLALGAVPVELRRTVIVQGMGVTLIGVLIGLIAAWGLTDLLRSLLFGIAARDLRVFVGAPILLSAVAFIAIWVPACRVTVVDPACTLREE